MRSCYLISDKLAAKVRFCKKFLFYKICNLYCCYLIRQSVLWYLMCKITLGAEELLKEDEKKETCRRFMSTGECQYGDACRHWHITPDLRQRLTEQSKNNWLYQPSTHIHTHPHTHTSLGIAHYPGTHTFTRTCTHTCTRTHMHLCNKGLY